jgi:hypothetical protein
MNMEDTSGFYKKDLDNNWFYAPNFVYNKDYTLEKEGNRDPIDGWQWHDEEPEEYKNWKNNLI